MSEKRKKEEEKGVRENFKRKAHNGQREDERGRKRKAEDKRG